MALAYRISTVHRGLAGGPYLSTFNFAVGDGADPDSVAALVGAFWTAASQVMSIGNVASTEGEAVAYDEATGDAVAAYPIQQRQASGQGGGGEWTAKQGLLTLNTNTFRVGKRVQGRLFIPAVPSGVGEQNPSASYTSAINGAASDLAADADDNGTPWCVFSRPRENPSRAGAISPITTTVTRQYWAVLRSRRD